MEYTAYNQEAQDSVRNKIKRSGDTGNHTPLGTKPNDECYTSMNDIMNELSYWADLGKFKGKNIICPCDWDIADGTDIYGITISYKDNSIEITGNNVYKAVKLVQIDVWADDEMPQKKTITLAEEEIESFLRGKLTCNFIKTFTQNARRWGIKSITASGYNPATGKGTPFQEVDYAQYDVCVTNPPFSLYNEFMECVVGKIDFILLASFNDRANKFISIPLMENTAYLGMGVHLALDFDNPIPEDKSHTKKVACDWIVSYPEAQIVRNALDYKSGIDYELYKNDYAIMPTMTMKDGTHPIQVPVQFPDNYNGWMFGGVNILDKLNQDAYEWYCTNCNKYFNTDYPEKNPFNHKINAGMYKKASGKGAYAGIVFRKKQVNKENK